MTLDHYVNKNKSIDRIRILFNTNENPLLRKRVYNIRLIYSISQAYIQHNIGLPTYAIKQNINL